MTEYPTSPVIANNPFHNPFDVEDAFTPPDVPQGVPQAIPPVAPRVTFEQAVASVLARIQDDVALENPEATFAEHAKAGDYDAISDGDYHALLGQVEGIAVAWRRQERLKDPAALVGRVLLGGHDTWLAWLRVEPLTRGISAPAIGTLDPAEPSSGTSARVDRMRGVAAELEGMFAGRLDERITNPAIDLARHDRHGVIVFDGPDRPLAAAALDRLSRDIWRELPQEAADVVAGRILMRADCGEAALDDLRCVRHLIGKQTKERGEAS